MILKLDGGKLELRNDNGSLIRTIASSNVVDADLNNDESLVVITYNNGRVELRNNKTGSLIRTLMISEAVKTRFQGSDIAITLDNGKVEIRNEHGSLIRKF